MDDSRSLAVESFSTTWLSNVEYSFDATSKIMDYKLVKPSGFLDETQNFKFDIPIPPSVFIADADELFFDGSIKPVYLDHTMLGIANTFDFIPDKHNSSLASLTCNPGTPNRSCQPKIWKRFFNRVLLRCLGCLNPIGHKDDLAEGAIACDIKQRSFEVESQHHSSQASPQGSNVSSTSTGDCCYIESSIHEAILHCKKSIEKSFSGPKEK